MSEPDLPTPPGFVRLLLWLFSLLLLITLFHPLLKAEYLFHYDDGTNILHNPWVIHVPFLEAWKVFFTPNTANQTFVPLTVFTFFLEHRLWGLHAPVSHLLNLFLHLSVTCLFYRFIRLTGFTATAAYIAALIFAIHPLHMEPVVWVSGRKDLLFSLFYLFSLINYCRYLKEGTPQTYFLSLLTGFLSVLSKPMAISLPLALFLVDYLMQRKPGRQIFFDKFLFIIVLWPVGWITYAMNARTGFFVWPDSILFWSDCAWFYIEKFFCPSGLTPLMLPDVSREWFSQRLFFSFLPLLFSFFTAFFCRNRLILFSFMFYAFGTFFLWRFDTGADLNYVAARFMYLPSIGFCMLAGFCFDRLFHRFRPGYIVGICFFVLIISFLVLSARQVRIWNNSCVFWQEVALRNPYFPEAWRWLAASYNNGGEGCEKQVAEIIARNTGVGFLQFQQRYSDSAFRKTEIVRWLLVLRYSRKALQLNPEGAQECNYIGRVFLFLACPSKALDYFNRAIELAPGEPLHYLFRAQAFAVLGRYDLAIEDYSQTIALGHVAVKVLSERADLLMAAGKPAQALEDLKRILYLRPLEKETYAKAFLAAIRSAQEEFAADVLAVEQKLFPEDVLLNEHKQLLEHLRKN